MRGEGEVKISEWKRRNVVRIVIGGYREWLVGVEVGGEVEWLELGCGVACAGAGMQGWRGGGLRHWPGELSGKSVWPSAVLVVP